MRNPQLHAALGAFAEEAAWQLAEAAEGEEMPFEVVAGGRRDTPLYCYRPLTGDFIADRRALLGGLESYPRAVHALASCGSVEAYLRRHGEPVAGAPRERAETALRSFLGRVFADSTEFELSAPRFRRAYDDLEDAVYDGRTESVVIAPLVGLAAASPEVALGEGLSLVAGEAFQDTAPVDALWARGARRAHLLAVLRWEAAPGDASPVAHGRVRLRALLTALRLYESGGFAFGPLGWTRTGTGPWDPFPLGTVGARNGATLVVSPEQEDELRGFCSLVARRMPRHGTLAWALRRHDMACDRTVPAEALSDLLLALRALIEPEGPQARTLPRRLAALCATPAERPPLAERVARVADLERDVIAGVADEPDIDALVAELGGHLRALLRDVLCGHLDADLCDVADAILAEPVAEPAAA